MKNEKSSIVCSGMEVPITYIQQETETTYLAIFLPGKGYTTQKPLLYYATSLYVEKGFDVPHLDYNELLQDLDKENCKEVINQVVQSFLQKHNYSKIHFVAKSIGTYALVHILQQNDIPNSQVIWLTPLLSVDKVYQTMLKSELGGSVFIGNKDPYYVEERFLKLEENPHLTLSLIPGANHSLEFENNTIQSIRVVEIIIEELQKIIQ